MHSVPVGRTEKVTVTPCHSNTYVAILTLALAGLLLTYFQDTVLLKVRYTQLL